jgi:hypothetical protein
MYGTCHHNHGNDQKGAKDDECRNPLRVAYGFVDEGESIQARNSQNRKRGQDDEPPDNRGPASEKTRDRFVAFVALVLHIEEHAIDELGVVELALLLELTQALA